MRNTAYRFARFSSVVICAATSTVAIAEPQLYPTGPKDVLSYVRFVNATDSVLTIPAIKTELSTKAEGRVSSFFSVKAGAKQTTTLQVNGKKVSVDVLGKPWEYITVVMLPKGANQFETSVVRETTEDFNASKASLGIFNLDVKCDAATLQDSLKRATKFADIKPFTLQRYLVSPVKLNANLVCGGQSASTPVDFPPMQSGESYSVFLMTLKNTQQAFLVHDIMNKNGI